MKEHQFISLRGKGRKDNGSLYCCVYDRRIFIWVHPDRIYCKKTNVKKEDIFKLANDLQKKDLNNEKDMRDFIQTVAKVTNQSLDQRKIDKLIKIMQNKDVLNDVEKMI